MTLQPGVAGYWTGHTPDPVGTKRTPFARMMARVGSKTAPYEAMALLAFATAVMNQGPTGSCTGHGTSGGIYADLNARGLPCFVPSPCGIYKGGLTIDRIWMPPGPPPLLVDEGAEPNMVLRGLAEYGIVPMVPLADRYSDCTPENVVREPQLGEIEAESTTLIVGAYSIPSVGKQRELDVQNILAAGKPIGCSIAGGCDLFQQYTGGVLPALNAPLDHFGLLLGYQAGGDEYLFRNSWDIDWGEYGNARLSRAALAELGDLIVFDVKVVKS